MRTLPDLRDLRGYAELSLLWKAISLLRTAEVFGLEDRSELMKESMEQAIKRLGIR